jgi:hypothetical protein
MNYNPRDLELLAWLASLDAETEYVMRCALIRVSPSFQQNKTFKDRIERLRAALDPSARRLAALSKRADRRAELIRAHLARDSAG